MNDSMEPELTPEERAALAALPREHDPGAGLRARVVNELRRRGTFAAMPPTASRPRLLSGIAAAAAIFAAGVWVGGAVARSAGDASAPTPLRVQRSGSAYVEAIAVLADDRDGAGAQGRDAALSAFRGAAEQLARFPGYDDETRRVLAAARGLEQRADTSAVERWF